MIVESASSFTTTEFCIFILYEFQEETSIKSLIFVQLLYHMWINMGEYWLKAFKERRTIQSDVKVMTYL